MNDGKPLTFWRALRASEFWLLIVAAVTSMSGVKWWIVVPLTVTGLSVASLPKYIALWPRARNVGADRAWWITVGLSMFNNLATACAAFVLGILIRWLWW